jgi:hypothetical protein
VKYFVKRSKTDGSVIALYRYLSDGKERTEEIWDATGRNWNETNLLFSYLAKGEPSLDEINLEAAKRIFPIAFAP